MYKHHGKVDQSTPHRPSSVTHELPLVLVHRPSGTILVEATPPPDAASKLLVLAEAFIGLFWPGSRAAAEVGRAWPMIASIGRPRSLFADPARVGPGVVAEFAASIWSCRAVRFRVSLAGGAPYSCLAVRDGSERVPSRHADPMVWKALPSGAPWLARSAEIDN